MLPKVSTGKSVLISGGSIAGPAIAWWLQRYGFRTTLVERWPGGIRPGGQNIDVNDQGREVVRRMGLEPAILAANTGEKGSVLTDVEGNERVLLPLGEDTISPTNETEILRGTSAQLLYDATAHHTEWRFGDQITSLDEQVAAEGVKVGFQSGREEVYDLVVLADGVGSRTRKLAFSPDDIEFKRLGIYIAYFTMPIEPTDPRSDHWVITNLPGKRCLSFRPGGDGLTQAFLMWTSPESAGYEKLPIAQQIAAIREQLEADPKWMGTSKLVQRAAKGLENTADLYLEYSGQVKAKRLFTQGGKVGMIGDAAYCGTPVSGAGTTLSLVGAYILAGELAKHAGPATAAADNGGDVKAGFQAYESWMAPFAAGLQNLPPGVPQIALPTTNWGIRVLHTAVGTALWLSKWKAVQWVAGWVFRDEGAQVVLSDYSEYEIKSSAESSEVDA